MQNRTLLQKADAVLTDLTGNGDLAPEQSARFVRKVIEAPTVIRESRTVEMRTPTQEINRIGFGSRILRPAVENTGLSSGDRSKPSFEKLTLSCTEVIAEVRLPYAMMENAIEQASIGQHRDAGGTALSGPFRDTVVDMIAERAARDLEELALLGDTGSGDSYLALKDGWIKLLDTLAGNNEYDNLSAGISQDVFAEAIKVLPDKYKRDLPTMKFYLNHNNLITYRQGLANRATGLGDAQIQGTAPVYGMGQPLTPAALWPSTSSALVDPRNLIMGMQRAVSMEFDKDISARQYIIVVTLKVDFKIDDVGAAVLIKNV